MKQNQTPNTANFRPTDFSAILQSHAQRYPLMQPQDFGKLIYQSEFGPQHMIACPAQSLSLLQHEWQSLPKQTPQPANPEPISNSLSRFHFASARRPEQAAPLLNRLFMLTAQKQRGSQSGLQNRLQQLLALPLAKQLPGLHQWLAEWQSCGWPPVHHSAHFRNAYQPHYRLLRTEYALFFPVLLAVEQFLTKDKPALLAIDGRCGSGKTHLAALLAELFPCRVLHMDDFYLPPAKRPVDWQQRPAGHMDLARFQQEVLQPAQSGQLITYQPYDCQQGRLLKPRQLPPAQLTVIEGSYSQHPQLAASYNLKIFLTINTAEQAARLQAREGDYYPAFVERWIPQEELYLQACGVEAKADIRLDCSGWF